MKRIVVVAITAIVLCGCNRGVERIENGSIRITHHEYKGHQYLRFKDYDYGDTFIHDPDCAKCDSISKSQKGGEE